MICSSCGQPLEHVDYPTVSATQSRPVAGSGYPYEEHERREADARSVAGQMSWVVEHHNA
jgi:hypothetical protein